MGDPWKRVCLTKINVLDKECFQVHLKTINNVMGTYLHLKP